MSTFTTTLNPTPFSFFDSDAIFQSEADAMITFVKRRLGDDILSVELTKKQIWACFEEAFLEYASIVNQYQAKSQLLSLLGMQTGSLDEATQKFPRDTLNYIVRLAEPYAVEAGLGGTYNTVSGSIHVFIAGVQFWLQDARDAFATLAVFLAAGTRIAPAVLRIQQNSIHWPDR